MRPVKVSGVICPLTRRFTAKSAPRVVSTLRPDSYCLSVFIATLTLMTSLDMKRKHNSSQDEAPNNDLRPQTVKRRLIGEHKDFLDEAGRFLAELDEFEHKEISDKLPILKTENL